MANAGWRYAFSIPKGEVNAAAPPGTSLLVEHDGQAGDHIQLIPPPSRSGSDPLNVCQSAHNATIVMRVC